MTVAQVLKGHPTQKTVRDSGKFKRPDPGETAEVCCSLLLKGPLNLGDIFLHIFVQLFLGKFSFSKKSSHLSSAPSCCGSVSAK